MKKIIAIVMVLVMMMAIAVPAFAEKKLDSATQAGDTTVIVDGTTTQGDGTYSVSIPAEINLTWGDTTAKDEYTITSQLATGKRVQVTLEKSKDLTNADGETIAFTATDATDGKTADEVVTDEVHEFNLAIDENAWKAVSIAAYSGTISFTAGLVNA